MKRLEEGLGSIPHVVDPSPKLSFGKVLPVLTVLLDEGLPFKIQAPPIPEPGAAKENESFAALHRRISEEVTRAGKDKDGLAKLVLKIRADRGARYGDVQMVMVAAMREYVWRITFTGTDGRREVEIGQVWWQTHEPPKASDTMIDGPIIPLVERDVIDRFFSGFHDAW